MRESTDFGVPEASIQAAVFDSSTGQRTGNWVHNNIPDEYNPKFTRADGYPESLPTFTQWGAENRLSAVIHIGKGGPCVFSMQLR